MDCSLVTCPVYFEILSSELITFGTKCYISLDYLKSNNRDDLGNCISFPLNLFPC
uniref:Uncharacterized protein n=1 Tax=Fundulus heteroclitus TaxID=8078 RepID=A0A3Q2QYE2_FUNHE